MNKDELEIAYVSVNKNEVELALIHKGNWESLIQLKSDSAELSDELKPVLGSLVEAEEIPKGIKPLLERMFPDGYFTKETWGLGHEKEIIICSKKYPVFGMSAGVD